MDNFYDINDFIVYLLKKWKICFGIIVLSVLAFAGSRAVGLMQDYKAQQSQGSADEEVQQESTEPMWSRVQQIIKVGPTYRNIGGEQTDITSQIVNTYRQLSGSEELLDTMYDTWYEKEQTEDGRRKQLFNEYGYILDKERDYPYARKDFYDQFLVDGNSVLGLSKSLASDNQDRQYVSVGFMSTNQELARQISEDYSSKLTKLVEEELGMGSFEVVETSVLYELPASSGGTQSSRVLKQASVSDNITKQVILKQTIKGAVWGGILGVLLVVVILFMMYMMTRRINVLNDLYKLELPVIAVGFLKGSHKFKTKVYSVLEGYHWKKNLEELTEKIRQHMEWQDGDKVLIIGSGQKQILQDMVEDLNRKTDGDKYVCADDVEFVENMKAILVEQFGVSMKNEIAQEIKKLQDSKVDILGVVGVE